MEHAFENEGFQFDEEEFDSLPPRREYHKRTKNREDKQEKGKRKKNPFLFVRLLLAAFIILVVGTIVLSISSQYFS